MRTVWLLLVLALTACESTSGGAGGAHTGGSGILVRTVVDKGCPTQPAGSRCPVVPVEARIVVDDGTTVTARATTGSDGQVRIPMRPGRYMVRAERPGAQINANSGPVTVTVTDGAFRTVTLQFDSGVRLPGPASP
jgi:hypothetical protein